VVKRKPSRQHQEDYSSDTSSDTSNSDSSSSSSSFSSPPSSEIDPNQPKPEHDPTNQPQQSTFLQQSGINNGLSLQLHEQEEHQEHDDNSDSSSSSYTRLASSSSSLPLSTHPKKRANAFARFMKALTPSCIK